MVLTSHMLEPGSITSCPTTQEYYSAGCCSTICGGTSCVSHVHQARTMLVQPLELMAVTTRGNLILYCPSLQKWLIGNCFVYFEWSAGILTRENCLRAWLIARARPIWEESMVEVSKLR